MTRGSRRGAGQKRTASRLDWVLLCEHASHALPRRYGTLGVTPERLRDHIGWDIGAADVMREAARRLGAPGVASRWSRLLIDCNRAARDPTLIPSFVDGTDVPGNVSIGGAERRHRLETYYAPYHVAVDRMIDRARRRTGPDGALRLLSVHSFTPIMAGRPRRFDVGVLFDRYEPLARALGRAMRERGYSVRYNQPYSGMAGLIYSARRHAQRARIPYVEIEINNALLRTPAATRRLGRDLAKALASLRV